LSYLCDDRLRGVSFQLSSDSQAHPASGITRAVILGAGPAGLSAAYELEKSGVHSLIIEKDQFCGGLSRTEEYKGYLFDLGGHRFYTKVPMIEQIWREVLGEDLIERPRLSRIFYRSKFFSYPLDFRNALSSLGHLESVRCLFSFLFSRFFPEKPEDHFEAWVSNRFGKRLFNVFFKTYTEKVWGVSCRELRSDWAAQRIRGLSLGILLRNALRTVQSQRDQPQAKTLISRFLYPRLGPGMMWSRMAELVQKKGSEVLFNTSVREILWEPGRITGIRTADGILRGTHYISSMAIRDLLGCLNPAPPEFLQRAAKCFHYRDFLTVVLIVRGKNLFPDNWLYIHDPGFKVGRIQNFNNWSPDMVPHPETTSLGLEYFCFENDSLWEMSDEQLLDLAGEELSGLGLVQRLAILDGVVRRVPKAYPVYDTQYKEGLAAVQEFLKGISNLQLIGRNGMHHYNNQDHSMVTGILAARNILGAKYNLWRVNSDPKYLEEGDEGLDALVDLAETQPLVPLTIEAREIA
jgi:protoporphyrinogen oxidase